MICGSSRFAVNCGLHSINSHVYRQNEFKSSATALLPNPSDQLELGERIFVWWETYALDKSISITTAFAGSMPGEHDEIAKVETVFPRSIDDYEAVSYPISYLFT